MENLTAVILAGGLGKRLRSVISENQKVIAEINGRPFLFYLFDQLIFSGIKTAVLCTGFHGDDVKGLLGSKYKNLKLLFSHEHEPLGTGGALRFALPLIKSDHVLVMNGDSYCDTDIKAFYEAFRRNSFLTTIALVEVPDTSRFGRIETSPEGRILEFREKEQNENPGWINAGIYVIQRNMLETIPEKKNVSLEKEIFPLWIKDGIYGFKNCGRFLDIGTPESYRKAKEFLLNINKPVSKTGF